MRSLILSTSTRYLLPLMLLFSIFILLRGHHHPGGGFIGGLVASTAFALYGFAFGITAARKVLRVDPMMLIGGGLLMVAVSGIMAPTSASPTLYDLDLGPHPLPGHRQIRYTIAL